MLAPAKVRTLDAASLLLPTWWDHRHERTRPAGDGRVRVEVGNPAIPGRKERVEFLIAPDALYSIVPTVILDRLGILPFREEDFLLADGTTTRRKIGAAVFRRGRRTGFANVVFGQGDDPTR